MRISKREMIIAMALGVAAGVISSVVERADAIMTGGNATPLGFVNTYTWILVSATLFGPVGAIITTEVQAFLGLITAANPLSWLWPPINFIFAAVVGSTSVTLSQLRPKTSIRTRLLLLSFVCAVLDIPLTYIVIVSVLGLPFAAYVLVLPFYIALQLIPSTIISYAILKAIIRSGTIGYSSK